MRLFRSLNLVASGGDFPTKCFLLINLTLASANQCLPVVQYTGKRAGNMAPEKWQVLSWMSELSKGFSQFHRNTAFCIVTPVLLLHFRDAQLRT
jgi:hypothetical protein